MCEIQLIRKLGKEKIDRADMGEFFKMMCFGSMGNNDAFGVFNHNTVFKKGGAFDASGLDEHSLTNGNFIIGHNRHASEWSNVNTPIEIERDNPSGIFSVGIPKSTRYATFSKWNWSIGMKENMYNIFLSTQRLGLIHLDSEGEGFEDDSLQLEDQDKNRIVNYVGSDKERNHHPFEIGDFKLIHNGTIINSQELHDKYRFQTTINTDSYIILELIVYFFKNSHIKDRVRRISSAIQSTCKELEGKYSVILYDKKGRNTIYFRNFLASFSLYKYGDNILCGSTSPENLNYLYFGMEKKNISIKSNRVYLITSNERTPVIDITLNNNNVGSGSVLYDILSKKEEKSIRIRKTETFLKEELGFIPSYKFAINGALKIATNNTDDIKEKINKIVKDPIRRFGWYIIKASDVRHKKAMNRQHKLFSRFLVDVSRTIHRVNLFSSRYRYRAIDLSTCTQGNFGNLLC